MAFFDVSKPGVQVIKAPMGGGWALPITDEGREALSEYFDEAAYPIEPLGGQEGWIVEPHQSPGIAALLIDRGIAWRVAE